MRCFFWTNANLFGLLLGTAASLLDEMAGFNGFSFVAERLGRSKLTSASLLTETGRREVEESLILEDDREFLPSSTLSSKSLRPLLGVGFELFVH